MAPKEENFKKENSQNILNNSYVVLRSVFEGPSPNFDVPTLESGVKGITASIADKKTEIINTLVNLREKSLDIENDFFTEILGLSIKKDPLEHSKKFTDFLKFKDFIQGNGKGPFETIITLKQFEEIMDKGLKEISEDYINGKILEENFQQRSTEILGTAITVGFKELSNDFFCNFNLDNSEIRKGIEKLWGASYLNEKLQEAKEGTFKSFHREFNETKNKNTNKQYGAIEGSFKGQVVEWIRPSFQNELKNGKNITYTFEDTGRAPIPHTRLFFENDIVVEGKEKKRKNAKKRKLSDPFSREFEIAQKTDTRIVFNIENGENIFAYKLNISNKFRSRNKKVKLQSSGVVNNQIMQIKEILGQEENVDKILKQVMFVTLNNVPDAFLDDKEYTEIINNFLQTVGIVYMFDNITTMEEINSSNIFLFQMNKGVLCVSAILDSIIMALSDTSKSSYIITKVKHRTLSAEQLYKEKVIDSKLKDRERHFRSLLSSEQQSASQYEATFDTNLMMTNLG